MLNKTTHQIIGLQLIGQILKPNNLDVRIIRLISELRDKIRLHPNPIFTINGSPVMDYYDEFKETGLSNLDYINTNFYISGFNNNNEDDEIPIQLQVVNQTYLSLDEGKIINTLTDILNSIANYIEVYLCKAIVELYRTINRYDLNSYNFTENGKSIMQYWDDFKDSEMPPIHYVTCEHYKNNNDLETK